MTGNSDSVPQRPRRMSVPVVRRGRGRGPRRAGASELCRPYCRHSPARRRSARSSPHRARGSSCGRAHACGGARERWSRGAVVTRAYSPTTPALNWAFARPFAVPIRLQSLHNCRDLRRGNRRSGACAGLGAGDSQLHSEPTKSPETGSWRVWRARSARSTRSVGPGCNRSPPIFCLPGSRCSPWLSRECRLRDGPRRFDKLLAV